MKVYVSKESKKEETKSTAYSFLLVSVFGFIALILFATGVLPVHVADYMKIMLYRYGCHAPHLLRDRHCVVAAVENTWHAGRKRK